MVSEADWRSTFDKMEKASVEIREKTNEIIRIVNKAPTWLWYTPGIADKLWSARWLAQGVTKLMEYLEPRFDEPGNPPKLSQHALDWNKLVGQPIERLIGPIEPTTFDGEGKWEGTAANSYKNHLLPNKNACVAFKTSTDDVGDVLQAQSNAVWEFWIELAVAAVALVAALVSTIVALRSGAWPAIVAALVAAGVCGGSWWASEHRLENNLKSNNLKLQQKSTNGALTGGGGANSWPNHLNVDMSDGSVNVTDGKVTDDTDWHVKPK
jgi:hypothetical protein